MKRIALFLLCLFIVSISFGQTDVQVTINSVAEVDTVIRVTFGLSNVRGVSGLQFDLIDEPDALQLLPSTVTALGRLASMGGLSLSSSEADSVAKFLWFSMMFDSVDAGTDEQIVADFRKIMPGDLPVFLKIDEIVATDGLGFGLTASGDSLNYNLSSIDEKLQYPSRYNLQQNYPNPFNPETEIKFEIPLDDVVSVSVYNLRGELVKNLISDRLVSGYYKVIWDGKNENGLDVASGTYIYRLDYGKGSITKKMMLIR